MISRNAQFNIRVSAVVLNAADSILLCKFEHQPFWMLPGGKVEQCESARAALARELTEEIGCKEPTVESFLVS
jgi:ADP-ribose pyrophosphatase YjhB (NUDIX family)